MGMPLDMVLACSNHASWNCGLLAFGLPSASNKLSQPDPSDVPSTLKSKEKERASKRDAESEAEGCGAGGRAGGWGGAKKREQVRMSQTDRKKEIENKKNESWSKTCYYPPTTSPPPPARPPPSVLIVQRRWGVLIHRGSTLWPPPSCYLQWGGTTVLPIA